MDEHPGRVGSEEDGSRSAHPGPSARGGDSRLWGVLFVLAVVWIAALLHRGQPLGWDELEFFRATRWIGEGRVPFRDFWEHHTPLQWLVFAPVARLFADGPGAGSIVVMRWAQVALWIGIFALVIRLSGKARWWALVFLVASPLFVRSAIEYRVDVLCNLLYFGAIVVAIKRRWAAFGVLMSLSVLANMRYAPLVVITAAILLMWDSREERWRWNASALWMLAGVAAVATPFVGWLAITRAWTPFLDGIFGYNAASSRVLNLNTLYQFAAPLWQLDLAAIVLGCAAIAGCVLALRQIRRPGLQQILALLFIASLVTIAAMAVQYEYHFQGVYLLMVPLAAATFSRVERWQWLALLTAATALILSILPVATQGFGGAMRYQDFVMREVDRRTTAGDRVFEGTGYALRREPAHRYWFLATGVRFLSAQGLIARYDIAADPPAAVIYNLRMQLWFEVFPKSAAYAVRHYVPLTRDLWVPGMTETLEPGRLLTWVAPGAGTFALWPSETLLRHPWLTKPLEYAAVQGEGATRYAIPLARLPLAQAIEWSVDGVPIAGRTARLRKGSRVTVLSRNSGRVGVLLVPSDLGMLCVGPAEEFQF